jgi:hypothetical protein
MDYGWIPPGRLLLPASESASDALAALADHLPQATVSLLQRELAVRKTEAELAAQQSMFGDCAFVASQWLNHRQPGERHFLAQGATGVGRRGWCGDNRTTWVKFQVDIW